jgi:serine/threonine protein kinase/WD40 repeat protein
MPDCPSDADLAGFLDESLPADRLTGVSAHVDGCPDCQARLDRLTRGSDTVAARYKHLSPALGTDTPPRGDRPAPPPDSSPFADTRVDGRKSPLIDPQFTGLPDVPGFEVLTEIGRGGMGVVFKARHRGLNRPCALKMVLAGSAAGPRVVQRFLFEAEVLARVQHPQVVQVYEVDTYQGSNGVPIPYLAMELLEGGTLSQRLRAGGPLDPRAAAALIEGVARGVHAAHLQGIVHRDLKPGNILFPAGSGQWAVASAEKSVSSLPTAHSPLPTPTPKVSDFGLAKFVEAGGDLTASWQIMGTPAYMAPEQATGNRAIGPGADVYSLGVILYECLAGRPPFDGPEPMSVLLKVVNDPAPDVRSLRPTVPRDLAAVTMKCLEKDPRRRYASAGELADDLRRFLDGRPTVARPLRRRERAWLWARRNPAVAGLLAALAVVLVAGFSAVTWFWLEAERTAANERQEKVRAERAERAAIAAHQDTTRALAVAELREANLEFYQAVALCEEGQVEAGLRRFLRAVELAESEPVRQLPGAADLARVARVNLAAWPAELPPPRTPFAHPRQPRMAAFTPDSDRMVTVGVDGTASLWDVKAGEKVHDYALDGRFARGLRAVPVVSDLTDGVMFWCVAVSPDGQTVAAGGSDGQVWVWDTERPQTRAAFPAAKSGNVWAVGFAPDGTLWAADGESGVRRWDVATGKMLAEMATPVPAKADPDTWIVMAIAVTRDGKWVFTGDRFGTVRAWNTQTQKAEFGWGTGRWVNDLALSPDDRHLAVAGAYGLARVYDLATRQPVREFDLAGAYGTGAAFAPSGRAVVFTDEDGTARAYDWATGELIGVPVRFSGGVRHPRFRPNSDEFAVPGGDTMYLCKVLDPPGVLLNPVAPRQVWGLDFAPDGGRVAVTAGTQLSVFDPRTGAPAREPIRTGDDALCLRFHPDGKQVVRGSRANLELIDLGTGKRTPAGGIDLLRLLPVARPRFYAAEVTPGGARVLAHDRTRVYTWDGALSTLSIRQRVIEPAAGVELRALASHPRGTEVLVSRARVVTFLDPVTLATRRTWEVEDDVLDARYTPDGAKVLVGLRNNSARLVDARTGERVIPPMDHARAVTGVAVSPDGSVLFTGSRDRTARFWDAATGLPLGPPLRHPGPVTVVAFSPAGDRVATGAATGHALVWKPPPPPLAGTPEEVRAKVHEWTGGLGRDANPPGH